MSEVVYSVASTTAGLKGILRQYLESQYHIWNESLVEERRLLLEESGTIAQGSFIEATPSYQRLASYAWLSIPQVAQELLIRCSEISGTGVFTEPYVHQGQALEQFLGSKRNLVVVTGTGSGKTETFLFPILGTLAVEASERPSAAALCGCRALLLYPMNALVNDQLARLRKLFGNPQVADLLGQPRSRRVRFGMYTSRTPYPGKQDPKRDAQLLGTRVKKLFQGVTAEKRLMLEKLGMWPAKDMLHFEQRGFTTSPTDTELYTRGEMQISCPDLLVTNYSMLEYMLLRPVEAKIFEQTATWLHSDPRNYLTVVLDEAHMYRGAAGAEVALLLRRLSSRLDAGPSKVRFILTSASLGSSEDADQVVCKFASDLTGTPASEFSIVRSHIRRLPKAEPGSPLTARALASLDRAAFLTPLATEAELLRVTNALECLRAALNLDIHVRHRTVSALRDAAFKLSEALPVAAHLANEITSTPTPSEKLEELLFPGVSGSAEAVEALIALVTFAHSETEDRPFLPVRLHLLFRGLGGVYACVDPSCSHRRGAASVPLLGRLFDTPRLHCKCGARVYELLTHRRCGAAFLRGFWREDNETFLWHEAPRDLGTVGERLIEVHLLAEPERSRRPDRTLWLHKSTGRLTFSEPSVEKEQYVSLQCASKAVKNRQPPLISYDRECPVCTREWTEGTQIMDLETKGEAPFAYLVREQVRLQPPTRPASKLFPNAGRKSLLFSDGRQKAARLARDIPRDVEKDTFRQLLVAAVRTLRDMGREAVPNSRYLYPAFLHELSHYHLRLFDGDAATELERHLHDHESDFGSDLARALSDSPDVRMPTQYITALLSQMGSPFYSLFALTLGFVAPRKERMQKIVEALPSVEPGLVESIAIVWIQNLLDRYAFDKCAARLRETAAGHVKPVWGEKTGFREHQVQLVQRLTGRPSREFNEAFFRFLCTQDQAHYLIDPSRVRIELAYDRPWFQCHQCTYLAPTTWSNCCPRCGGVDVARVNPEQSPYLRSRKGLWRDPVTEMLGGTVTPFTLNVQEHTAQLGHRDPEDVSSTTELFERRFRDVLIHDEDQPVDVLSCTTTMEVGIDIGSLVAVGLRNVPPQRQNYQQRAGRAGRRGSSLATVLTYAQNNPHDNYYYNEPSGMISGRPPDPAVDTKNPKLIQRHVNAQLLQAFFRSQIGRVEDVGPGIYSSWGKTWDFFAGSGDFALAEFASWIHEDPDAKLEIARIEAWLPPATASTVPDVCDAMLRAVRAVKPEEPPNAPDDELLEYLFSKAVLPAYAFPRDLLSLRIEKHAKNGIELEQQPQQGLHIALSEYAPGRFVVVNKATYQVGAIAANRSSNTTDRAKPLFAHDVRYIQCTNCYHTEECTPAFTQEQACAHCNSGMLRVARIVQPEIVYPRGRGPIDELSDDPIFSDVTTAQLPFPAGGRQLELRPCGDRVEVASGHNENLVVVNRGFDGGTGTNGFVVCNLCGHVQLPGEQLSARHQRDYDVWSRGRVQPRDCDGSFEPVFLGYTFPTDLLLLRIRLEAPFNCDYDVPIRRRPLVDAVRSLSEALALAASRELQIDPRELRSGFRFFDALGTRYADLFLYDTLAGGAGYSTLAGLVVERILSEAERLLMRCDCTSSCNKCLRTYDNRMFQTSLDRFMALDLLAYARLGAVPEIPDARTQAEWLADLANMLRLEGWLVKSTTSAALEIVKGDSRHRILCYPSLRDTGSIAAPRDVLCFSRYDVMNRLPNVFAEIR